MGLQFGEIARDSGKPPGFINTWKPVVRCLRGLCSQRAESLLSVSRACRCQEAKCTRRGVMACLSTYERELCDEGGGRSRALNGDNRNGAGGPPPPRRGGGRARRHW